MSTNQSTYLKTLLEANIKQEENTRTFIFQKERIGLKNSLEITFLEEVEPQIRKEIVMTDDELIIKATVPQSYKEFDALRREDEKARWIFAYQLVEKVKRQPYPRLNTVVCPENIVYDTGMTPFFLHYGVMESLPPFVNEEERIWRETKATVAAAIDPSRAFDDYVHYHETVELSTIPAEIMSMADHSSLLEFIETELQVLQKKESTYVKLPQKKWKTSKFASIGLGILLIPAILFILYTFIYEQPRQEAYLNSHEHYLANKYSDVVTILSQQRVKKMPYVVLYELAHASVINEKLTEAQKENVLNNITLQTDASYLKYWIYIGRAEAEKAIDIARSLEDGELITYGLLKRREEIQAESKLSGEEKQQLLKEIDMEVEEYEKLMKENEEADKAEEDRAAEEKAAKEKKEKERAAEKAAAEEAAKEKVEQENEEKKESSDN